MKKIFISFIIILIIGILLIPLKKATYLQLPNSKEIQSIKIRSQNNKITINRSLEIHKIINILNKCQKTTLTINKQIINSEIIDLTIITKNEYLYFHLFQQKNDYFIYQSQIGFFQISLLDYQQIYDYIAPKKEV